MPSTIMVINLTIEVPNITAQEIERIKLVDGDYTAGGLYREDLVGDKPLKKIWRIDLRRITKEEYDAVIGYLDSIYWTRTLFWLDEFGGSPDTHSIYAVFEPGRDIRVPFGRSGAWHSSGRNVSLIVRAEE